MARPRLILSSIHAYHVRARSNNREWFYLPKTECWTIFSHYIQKTIELYQIQVHVFVLMDNHFHMIVSTPMANLDTAMQYLMRETSKAIGRASGRINRIYGGRYQRSVLETDNYFRNAYKYITRNPVAANLCEKVEDYPYSSLQWTIGRTPSLFTTTALYSSLIPSRVDELLDWLNQSYHPLQSELIRRGLRRQRFGWSSTSRFREWVGRM